MVWQERVLPESDLELLIAWYACGKSYAGTARLYGCSESGVRSRVKRVLKKMEAEHEGL